MSDNLDYSAESVETEKLFKEFRESLDHDKRANVLQFAESFSKEIYQSELERENSILQQASNMQGAFSFVTAGLFVIAEIVTDNKGENTPYLTVIIPFFFITLLLLFSLFFATRAQERMKKDMGPPSIEGFVKSITDQKDAIKADGVREILSIKQYNGYYKSLCEVNEKRKKRINISMWFFYAAMIVSFISAFYMLWADYHYNCI